MIGMEMDSPRAMMSIVACSMLPETLLSFVAGLLMGALHFTSLRWLTDFYANGRIRTAIGLHAMRLLIMAAVLFGLARMGASYLIAGTLGVVVSRVIVVRYWTRKA